MPTWCWASRPPHPETEPSCRLSVVLRVHYLRRVLVIATAVAILRAMAPAACPGDLDGDGIVTVNEIITAVNAALNGCPADPCPGDLNADHVVSIDEIMKTVIAALHGCDSTATPTTTATATPTPTLGHCPYTFLDDTLALGMSCGYSGAFSTNPACPTDLSALVLSDPTNGNLVGASVGSEPLITFLGVASSSTEAAIVGYFVGSDQTPQPLSGVMQLSDNQDTLVIDPDTIPSFKIGGLDCSFDRYSGTFTRVVGDQARRLTARREQVDALRAVLAGPRRSR